MMALECLFNAQLRYLREHFLFSWNHTVCLILNDIYLFSPHSFNLMCLYVNLPPGSGTVMCGLVVFELQDKEIYY